MRRPESTQNRGLLAGFSPLAGVSAGTALVLFAFGVLCLAWHQVSGHVSLAITMLAYAVIAALAVVTGAGTWLVVLWVAHRHRNPELLVRQVVRAEVVDPAAPPAIAAAQPAAIEPPRVYLNVTPDQLATLVRQQVTDTQLPRDNHDQGTA
jgi:apolipoprotein N-acyltransferase